MPFILDMPNHQPTVVPIPTTSTIQPLTIALIASTSSNGVDNIEEMMKMMMHNID